MQARARADEPRMYRTAEEIQVAVDKLCEPIARAQCAKGVGRAKRPFCKNKLEMSQAIVRSTTQRRGSTDLTVGHIATILISSRAGVASRMDSNHGAIRY